MTTYKERLDYLNNCLQDEDCPPRVYTRYRAEALRINTRLNDHHGPDGVEEDDEIKKERNIN